MLDNYKILIINNGIKSMANIYGTTTKISAQSLEIIAANTESRYNLCMLYALGAYQSIPR